jgi:hypothetical protein
MGITTKKAVLKPRLHQSARRTNARTRQIHILQIPGENDFANPRINRKSAERYGRLDCRTPRRLLNEQPDRSGDLTNVKTRRLPAEKGETK